MGHGKCHTVILATPVISTTESMTRSTTGKLNVVGSSWPASRGHSVGKYTTMGWDGIGGLVMRAGDVMVHGRAGQGQRQRQLLGSFLNTDDASSFSARERTSSSACCSYNRLSSLFVVHA